MRHALAIGGDEGRDDEDRDQRTVRAFVTQRETRRRQSGLELVDRQERARDMLLPQRERDRILRGLKRRRARRLLARGLTSDRGEKSASALVGQRNFRRTG